jgi:hypothetical protein
VFLAAIEGFLQNLIFLLQQLFLNFEKILDWGKLNFF